MARRDDEPLRVWCAVIGEWALAGAPFSRFRESQRGPVSGASVIAERTGVGVYASLKEWLRRVRLCGVEGSRRDYDEPFEVSDSLDSVYGSPDHEGANVCRVAAISTMLRGNSAAIRDVTDEVAALGFPPSLSSGDFAWNDREWPQLLERIEASPEAEQSRVSAWQTLRETAQPDAAIAFVVAVLGSELERESAVAAAVLARQIGFAPVPALRPIGPWLWDIWEDIYDIGGPDWPGFLWWDGAELGRYGWGGDLEDPEIVPWRPEQWTRIYNRAMRRFGGRYEKALVLNLLVRWRLAQALRSPDPITRSLATSAFLPVGDEGVEPPEAAPPQSRGVAVSTMIHGTFGWKGDWWRPHPAGFHDFIRNAHRPNLYSGGARFSWSGAYSAPQRGLAASDFCDWTKEMARAGVESVFAHSYGGEVAARSKIAGAAIEQIVLLSSPVNGYIDAVANDPALRVVDVRLNFDSVLAVAGVRQRIRPLPPSVTEVILTAWRLDHAATHKETVWVSEDVAVRGGI